MKASLHEAQSLRGDAVFAAAEITVASGAVSTVYSDDNWIASASKTATGTITCVLRDAWVGAVVDVSLLQGTPTDQIVSVISKAVASKSIVIGTWDISAAGLADISGSIQVIARLRTRS